MDIDALSKDLVNVLAPCLRLLLTVGGEVAKGTARKVGADVWDRAKELWTKLGPKVAGNQAIKGALR